MKKILGCILIVIITFYTSLGCDFKDIDRRIFIVAIGIDINTENPDLMTVSLKAAMPTSGGESGGAGSSPERSNSDIYTISGDSLADIFRRIKSETSLEPDFGHMKLIVFGQRFVNEHEIYNIIDFFMRRRDFQNIAWISVGLPSAKAVLSFAPKEERIPGNSLFMKFGQGSESPYAYKKRLFEFYNDILTPGCAPACSVLELKGDKIDMSRAAIFSNNRLALMLTVSETEIFNLLSQKIRLGSLSLKSQEKSPPIAIGLNRGSSKFNLSKTDEGDLTCTITTKIDATLEEVDKFSGKVEELTPKFENSLKKQITALLNKFKENKVDPLHVQMLYWAQDKNYMPTNKWLTDMFPNIKFEVNPKIDLSHTGTLKSE